MRDFCKLIWWLLVGLFRSRAALEAENLVLRQQINVLRRTRPKRPAFSRTDRLIFVGLCRWVPDVRAALAIIKPDTVMRWHRAGFRAYWRWKSRSRGGRPTVVATKNLIPMAKVENRGMIRPNGRDLDTAP